MRRKRVSYNTSKMKKKLIFLIFITFIGCEKQQYIDKFIPEPAEKKHNLFVVAKLNWDPIVMENTTQNLHKKMLGPWWDMLDWIYKNSSKYPVSISIPPALVIKFQNEIQISPLIYKSPVELDSNEIKILMEKYAVQFDTMSILNAQIKKGLSYFGEVLKNEPLIREFLNRNEFTYSDKEKFVKFMKEKLLEFDLFLKRVLDLDDIGEATTSLSDAYINLLDDARIKTQILESIVIYKKWRGAFPDGFIFRGGYADSRAIYEIEKTPLKWVVVSSTMPYIRTEPQVLYMEAINDYAVLITNPEDLKNIIKNRKTMNFEGFVYGIFDGIKEPISISNSPFVASSLKLTPSLIKMKNFLKSANDAIENYRNSGRANLRTLMKLEEKRLLIESGELYEPHINMLEWCENYKKKYDKIFRKMLIEIYSEIGISPPVELFIPLIEMPLFQIDEMKKLPVDIKCDGINMPGEWEGAFNIKFDTGPLKEVHWSRSKKNIYFMMHFSTDAVDAAGVYLGHMNVPQASLVPRGRKMTFENIQNFPLYLEVNWRSRAPEKTIIYRTAGDEIWEVLTNHFDVGYSNRILEFSLPLKYVDIRPKRKIFMKFYTEGVEKKIFPEEKILTISAPDSKRVRSIISHIDPAGDNFGPGNYLYPDRLKDYKGNFDFRRIEVNQTEDEHIITIELSALENIYFAPLGFSGVVIDIYIDINDRPGLGRLSLLEKRNAFTTPRNAWEFAISLNGWKAGVYNTAGRKIFEPEIMVNPTRNIINIFIPTDIIMASVKRWSVVPVLLAGDEEGKVIEISYDTSVNNEEFRGRINESDTNILDVILPSGFVQKRILGANRRGGAIEILGLKKR